MPVPTSFLIPPRALRLLPPALPPSSSARPLGAPLLSNTLFANFVRVDTAMARTWSTRTNRPIAALGCRCTTISRELVVSLVLAGGIALAQWPRLYSGISSHRCYSRTSRRPSRWAPRCSPYLRTDHSQFFGSRACNAPLKITSIPVTFARFRKLLVTLGMESWPLSLFLRRRGKDSCDFITDLPLSNDMDSILVFVDRVTKMSHFVACSKSTSAPEFARLFPTSSDYMDFPIPSLPSISGLPLLRS